MIMSYGYGLWERGMAMAKSKKERMQLANWWWSNLPYEKAREYVLKMYEEEFLGEEEAVEVKILRKVPRTYHGK